MSRAAHVLVVCTGNVCRSPYVHRLLVAELGAGVRVASAGTGALEGYPMDRRAAERLRRAGGDPEGFVARQVDEEILDGADLVLTATRAHRGQTDKSGADYIDHPRRVAQRVLDEDAADVVFVGRAFQKNPGTVWKFAEDLGVLITQAHQIEWGFIGRGVGRNAVKQK